MHCSHLRFGARLFIPIPTDWHALLCVSRLRGPRRQQRGMGLPWVAPRPQPQAPSQGRQGALLPRRMGWRRGLPVIVRASGSPKLWTRASQRQVSLCVCQLHLLSVLGLSPNTEGGGTWEKPMMPCGILLPGSMWNIACWIINGLTVCGSDFFLLNWDQTVHHNVFVTALSVNLYLLYPSCCLQSKASDHTVIFWLLILQASNSSIPLPSSSQLPHNNISSPLPDFSPFFLHLLPPPLLCLPSLLLLSNLSAADWVFQAQLPRECSLSHGPRRRHHHLASPPGQRQSPPTRLHLLSTPNPSPLPPDSSQCLPHWIVGFCRLRQLPLCPLLDASSGGGPGRQQQLL